MYFVQIHCATVQSAVSWMEDIFILFNYINHIIWGQPYNLRSSLWHWAWFGHLRPCMLDLNRGKSMIRKIWSFATFQIEINWNFFWTGLPKAYPQARLSGLGHCHLLEEMGVIPGMGSSRSFSGVLHLEKLKQTCFHLVICWTVAPAGI